MLPEEPPSSLPQGGKEGKIRVWVCGICASHRCRQRGFLNANYSGWVAPSCPPAPSLPFPSLLRGTITGKAGVTFLQLVAFHRHVRL